MNPFHASFLALFFVFGFQAAQAQSAGKPAVSKSWNAQWIAASGDDNGRGYGIYYFRKAIDLPDKPQSFPVRVSADNRYKLFVNGSLAALGPARGDMAHWNYETVDLSPFLRAGKNTVAALVYNEADVRPEAQDTFRTAFVLQGDTAAEEILNTNDTWKCVRDEARRPVTGFFAASVGEQVEMGKTIKRWNSPDFDDSSWPRATGLFGASPKGQSDGFGWMLVPSPLPAMERTDERIPVLRKVTGVEEPAKFPSEKIPVTIPANTTATFLLDQTHLTNAFVTLDFSGGRDAAISLRYAESLFENPKTARKGNRNEVDGKEFVGREDRLIADGSKGQTFTTLNFRTYRYIQLTVKTAEDPLVIDDIYGTFIGYPFKQTAEFRSGDAELQNILDIGWRTARLNAVETYTDCPYYEQLQYIGDTRIQAMVSYFYSGDDRLARNALDLMDHSRLPEGITLSRYPTHSAQIIPPFSLWYIGMLHDYWMYRGDAVFIGAKLGGTRTILDFFSRYQGADGSLKNVPYWNFTDWAGGDGWGAGAPPKSPEGHSAILDLQLLWAYQSAAEMEAAMGMPAFAELYTKKAEQLQKTIREKYWDPARGLISDTEEMNKFSQHANALAILTGTIPKADIADVGKKLLDDKSLTQCSIYFKYYLHMALVEAGLGDQYLDWLGIWRENIKLGLTTWAEDSNVQTARSDCHAWGSSPNVEFFRTVLGIDTAAPGFEKIKIEPHLGKLTDVSGEIPHPRGKIAAAYRLENGQWTVKIALPPETSGTFVWKGETHPLKAGENTLKIPQGSS
jgi:hypothetical protein